MAKAPAKKRIFFYDSWMQYYANNILHSFGGGGTKEKNINLADVIFYQCPNIIPKLKILKKQKHKNLLIILFSGEPANHAGHFCDILVDCKDEISMRPKNCKFIYFPLFARSCLLRTNFSVDTLLNSKEKHRQQKIKFCAFLYHRDHLNRNQFLYQLMGEYKPVDILGKAPRNYKGPHRVKSTKNDRFSKTFVDGAVERYIPYKFVIAFENVDKNGYITEKIMNAMLAGAIPIFWGTNKIHEHFNSKSFIHVSSSESNSSESNSRAIKKIKDINENDDLYSEMINEPWFAGENLYLKNYRHLLSDALALPK